MTTERPGAILVVEHDKPAREALVRELESLGHAATPADSARQATAILITHPFDLVLLNAQLPGDGSAVFLKRLRDDADLPKVPVVALGPAEAVAACLALGAEDFLLRPYTAAMLAGRVLAALERVRLRREGVELRGRLDRETKRADALLELVIPLGVALAGERNFDRLLERILNDAKSVCNADGGTLYLMTPDQRLKFEIVRNDTLKFALGGTTGQAVTFAPLRLFAEADGVPNHHNVATHCALTGQTVNIPDAYRAEGFDFSGTRAFDQQSGYRSKSFLTIPLKNPAKEVIGVLQLINARQPDSDTVVPFDENVQRMVESLSALATVALEAYMREQELKDQIQQLQIEIDEVKRERQVAEITETDYFQSLQKKAQTLRSQKK